MIPEAFSAIVHHLAPSVANNMLQFRPSNLTLIIKLDILPIKDDLDPRNLGRIPTPTPRQQAAEKKISHAAPPTAHWTAPSLRAGPHDAHRDRRHCVGQAV
jgi:hypothetical protein